ncbi:MlaA family lipoprotein [Arsukibacterium sp.]|uniref:MlaA family lipoprotein n=1 Tax=Arsukibacterium sp. TaxID=1977258 RepID=UPI002FD89C68
MTHRYSLICMLICWLSACASNTELAEDSSSQSVRASEQAAQPTADSGQASAAKRLAAGQTTRITTSQGTIEIEPTVVDMQVLAEDAEPGSEPASIYYDPLESWNRAVFRFNHVSYTYASIPLAKGYETVLPLPVRDKVGNAFANIREPLNLVNNALSGEIKGAGANVSRFVINSTLGIFGLFDPATSWFDIAESKRSIADTLGHYNVGHGPYLVLPILGQSDLRGATSVVGEAVFHPLNQVLDTPDLYYVQGLNITNSFADRAKLYQTLYQQSADPYIYFRNQHLQALKRDQAFVKPD